MPSEQQEVSDEKRKFASLRRLGLKHCPYCGDPEVYRSRTEPLTWLDRICGFVLLRLVRCHQCELRHYRPIFLPTPEYSHPIPARAAGATGTEAKRKRSA